MSSQPLIIVIGIAIVVNLVIMGALIVTLVRRRRPEPPPPIASFDDRRSGDDPPAVAPVDPGQPDPEPDSFPDPSQESSATVTAADDARRFRSVLEDEPHSADQEAIAFFVSPPTALGPREQPPEPSYESQFEPSPPEPTDHGDGPEEQTVVWTDATRPGSPEPRALASVDEAVDWERRVREESTRLSRYRRPVTVLLAELDGFDRLVTRLGSQAGERLIPAIADTLVRNGRATDHVARLGPSRFAVLMPETDEIEAINYAERIRAQCDRWLAAGSVSTRLALGWACPAAGTDLSTAVKIAEERLQGDRRRANRAGIAG